MQSSFCVPALLWGGIEGGKRGEKILFTPKKSLQAAFQSQLLVSVAGLQYLLKGGEWNREPSFPKLGGIGVDC